MPIQKSDSMTNEMRGSRLERDETKWRMSKKGCGTLSQLIA